MENSKDLQEQLTVDKLKLQLQMLEAQKQQIQAAGLLETTGWGQRVPQSEYPWNDSYKDFGLGAPSTGIVTRVDDRTDGKYLPVYRTEYDLRRMRARHRSLFHFVSVISGLSDTLVNYIVGEGFTVEITPSKQFESDPEARRISNTLQLLVDDFLESIDFNGGLDNDIVNSTITDGEVFLAMYPDSTGKRGGFPSVRKIEPDEVTEPQNPLPIERWLGTLDQFESFWDFGVHTRFCPELKRNDVENPLGYHVVFNDGGTEWDYIPEDRMIHVKRNVTRRAKRGVSDILAVEVEVDKTAKLRERTADGAIAQAAIAFIRQWNATKSDVESLVSEQFGIDVQRPKDRGLSTKRAVALDRTRIIDIPQGAQYQAGPLGTLRSPVFVEVAQFLLRLAAVRWAMPEFLISGDASNNNFASTLVTESPFVKARERDQRFFSKPIKELIEKFIRIYHSTHRFDRVATEWNVFRRLFNIVITPSEVATRDKQAAAQYNKVLNDSGIKSKRTWASEEGLDYDAEQENIQSEPQQASSMPGFGGSSQSPFPESVIAGIEAIRYHNSSVGLSEGTSGCGTGKGGFGNDNTCAVGHGSNKKDLLGRDETDVTLSGKPEIELRSENEDYKRASKVLLGKEISSEDIANLVGAPDTSIAHVTAGFASLDKNQEIRTYYRDQSLGIRASRTISLDEFGHPIIRNEEFIISPSKEGKGIGTRVFANEVAEASKAGISSIRTNAARNSDLNGYYTWPRLGYDGELPESTQTKVRDAVFTGKLPHSPTLDRDGNIHVSDLMKTEKGRKWWKENGHGLNVEFDLSKGSQSRRVLRKYLQKRFGDTMGVTESQTPAGVPQDPQDPQQRLEYPDTLTPEEDSILASVWDEIAAEDGAIQEGTTGCGTGKGGFGTGNTCAVGHGGPKTKVSPEEEARLKALPTDEKLNIITGNAAKRAVLLRNRLIEKHGFTYQPLSDTEPDRGFVVSIFPQDSLVLEGQSATPKIIKDYIVDHARRFTNTKIKVGGWYSTDDDKTFLDVNVVLKDKAKAIRLGKKHDQISIFDLLTGETIFIGGTGGVRESDNRGTPIKFTMLTIDPSTMSEAEIETAAEKLAKQLNTFRTEGQAA